MNNSSALELLFAFLSYDALVQVKHCSRVVARYVKSSHQNDPCLTVLGVLGVLLALYAIRTLVQSRTRAEDGEKRFIQSSENARLSLLGGCAALHLTPSRLSGMDTRASW